MILRTLFLWIALSLLVIAPASAQSYGYDDAGRLIRVVYGDGGGIAYTYDDADNLLASVLLQVPPAPTDVTATRLSENSARVMWPATDGATGYIIERREEGSSVWEQVASVGSGATSFIDTTLEAGKNYVYRVAANSSDGPGAFSNEAGFDTIGNPLISQGGVLNGASFEDRPLVPGAIFSIFGPNLGQQPTEFGGVEPVTAVAGLPPLPFELAGYEVEVAGLPAALYFVGSGQINAQVPWGVPAGNRALIVRQTIAGEVFESDPYMIDVAAVGPAIFTFDNGGTGKAVAINVKLSTEDDVMPGSVAHPAGTFPFLPSQPAARGNVIALYTTALGPVTPPVADGADSNDGLRETTIPVQVFIGGAQATVYFSGLTPQFPGVYQINVEIPLGAVPGNAVPIRIVQGGVESQAGVTIAVR